MWLSDIGCTVLDCTSILATSSQGMFACVCDAVSLKTYEKNAHLSSDVCVAIAKLFQAKGRSLSKRTMQLFLGSVSTSRLGSVIAFVAS